MNKVDYIRNDRRGHKVPSGGTFRCTDLVSVNLSANVVVARLSQKCGINTTRCYEELTCWIFNSASSVLRL